MSPVGSINAVARRARSIRVEPCHVELADAGVWWQWIRAMEFRGHIDRLPRADQAALRASAAQEFSDDAQPERISFPMDALLARARAPIRD